LTDSVLTLDRATFEALSPLAQATAIVLERRGEVRIITDGNEEGQESGAAATVHPHRKVPPGCNPGGAL